MEKKKPTSILTGESTLTKEEMAAIDEQILSERKARFLEAAKLWIRQDEEVREKLIELTKAPRKGRRGPQKQAWEEYSFLDYCDIALTHFGNQSPRVKRDLIWGMIADRYKYEDAKSAENRYRLLKKRHKEWCDTTSNKSKKAKNP